MGDSNKILINDLGRVPAMFGEESRHVRGYPGETGNTLILRIRRTHQRTAGGFVVLHILHQHRVIRVGQAQLGHQLERMRAVAIFRRAQVSQHRAIANVVVCHIQVGEGQRRHIGAFVQDALLHKKPGRLILLGGAAIHGTAQGRQGGLVITRLDVDHAQLPIGIRVGGVKGEGFLGITGRNEEFPLLGIGLGNGDVGQRILDPKRLVDGGGLLEVFQGSVEHLQLAIDQPDAQGEEGQVGGDLGSLDVLIDGVPVIGPRFKHGAQNTVGVHRIRRQLHRLGGVLLGLVPLLLVQQDFGVIGQRHGIFRVEQVGAGGGGLSLGQVAFTLLVRDQVGGGVPVQHKSVDGRDGAIVGGKLNPLLHRNQGFLQAIQAFLVGPQVAGGIGLDAGQLRPGLGIIGVYLQCLLIRPNGILVGGWVIQFPSRKVSLRGQDVGLRAAGGRGRGVER